MAISSRRNRLEVDTDLKVGDIVRVGDQRWYDSLPEYTGKFHPLGSNGVEKWPNKDNNTVFTEDMKRYLDKRVRVVYVIHDSDGPNYTVCGVDEELPEIEQFIFTNDMLFYD